MQQHVPVYGNFIWPGFGDNMRVLDWIIKRVEGKVDAVETPIGFLPKKGDINLKGIEDEVTSEVEDKLLAVDVDLWKKEIAEMRRYYNDDIKAKAATFRRLSTMSSTRSRLDSTRLDCLPKVS